MNTVKALRGRLSAFHQSMTLAVGVSHMTVIMSKYAPSTPTLPRVFIMNGFEFQQPFLRLLRLCHTD